jgi:hypothetical protein
MDVNDPLPPKGEPSEAEADQYLEVLKDAMSAHMYFPQQNADSGLDVFRDIEKRNSSMAVNSRLDRTRVVRASVGSRSASCWRYVGKREPNDAAAKPLARATSVKGVPWSRTSNWHPSHVDATETGTASSPYSHGSSE